MPPPVQFARRVALRHGVRGAHAEEITGLGSENHVVVVGEGAGRVVVRFARDRSKPAVFASEAWCARRSATAGVPTAEILATGTLDGIDYGVQELVPGRPTATGPAAWETLGAYAAAIHRIVPDGDAPDVLFTRFGRDPAAAWHSHLAYNLDRLTDDDDVLLRLGAYSVAERAEIRDRAAALRDVPFSFGLSHGDLSVRNLLVRTDGPPVLLDWGCASFGPALYLDLLALERERDTTGHPSAEEMDAFVAGAEADRSMIATVLPAFRLVQRHDLVRWALERRPDRLDESVSGLRAALAME